MIKNILLIALFSCFIFADFNLCQEDNYSTQAISFMKKYELCNEQNITKSIKMLEPFAKQGNPHSEFILGEIYLYGIGGVPRDFKLAYIMHDRAHHHGYNGSAVPLGKMNILAYGREQDCKKGIELLCIAKNLPVSSYILGLIYYSGLCNDVNITKAENYFKYAAENGHGESQYYLAHLLFKKDSDKNKDRVLKLLTMSAESGYVEAQVVLGHEYILGEDVEQDYKKAKYWIKKAKDQNSTKSIELWNKYNLSKY